MNKMRYRAGDWVEVRTKEEILQTLDSKGQLDGLPFMPEMFQFCGRRFKVYKRAHKTCDTVNDYKGRKMDRAVHLEGIRCDGKAHGGCDAACLIYWKEVWLKEVADSRAPEKVPSSHEPRVGFASGHGCREEDVWSGTKATPGEKPEDPIYVCQATQVPAATKPLAWWDVRQYFEDWSSGNVGLAGIARGFLYMGFRGLENAGIGLGRPLRWFYELIQRLSGGVPYPRRVGQVPAGSKTPTASLNLQPGEWVRVKSYEEILATLDVNNKNRGLYFDAEMVPYCGRTFRVMRLVKRIVDEKTGRDDQLQEPVHHA